MKINLKLFSTGFQLEGVCSWAAVNIFKNHKTGKHYL
jgi:hypothetical protein